MRATLWIIHLGFDILTLKMSQIDHEVNAQSTITIMFSSDKSILVFHKNAIQANTLQKSLSCLQHFDMFIFNRWL